MDMKPWASQPLLSQDGDQRHLGRVDRVHETGHPILFTKLNTSKDLLWAWHSAELAECRRPKSAVQKGGVRWGPLY